LSARPVPSLRKQQQVSGLLKTSGDMLAKEIVDIFDEFINDEFKESV